VKGGCAVTGAGSGIGRAAALRLGRAGYEVAAIDRDGDGASDVAKEICASGGKAYSVELDVRDESAVRGALTALHASAGLAGLVTSAAIAGPVAPIDANTVDEINEIFAVNALGSMLAVKHAAQIMRTAGGGAIVCVASAAALVGSPGRSAYCASKGAVIAYAKTAAVELAPENIRVNVVCPGIVDTPMVRRMWEQPGGEVPTTFDNLISRMAAPDEVAAAIAFLISDEASFIFGTELVVDGGKVAR